MDGLEMALVSSLGPLGRYALAFSAQTYWRL